MMAERMKVPPEPSMDIPPFFTVIVYAGVVLGAFGVQNYDFYAF